MAKYAQGYGRKNSDTKNLIILISSIVGAIVAAMAIVIIVGFVTGKKTTKVLKDYTDYEITDYSLVLDQDETDYLVYVYDSSNQSGTNDSTVMEYLDKYSKGKIEAKLYIIDYHLWNLEAYQSSDSNYSTIQANHEAIDDEINYELAEGYLIKVLGNKMVDSATQIITNQTTQGSRLSVKDILKDYIKTGKGEI